MATNGHRHILIKMLFGNVDEHGNLKSPLIGLNILHFDSSVNLGVEEIHQCIFGNPQVHLVNHGEDDVCMDGTLHSPMDFDDIKELATDEERMDTSEDNGNLLPTNEKLPSRPLVEDYFHKIENLQHVSSYISSTVPTNEELLSRPSTVPSNEELPPRPSVPRLQESCYTFKSWQQPSEMEGVCSNDSFMYSTSNPSNMNHCI